MTGLCKAAGEYLKMVNIYCVIDYCHHQLLANIGEMRINIFPIRQVIIIKYTDAFTDTRDEISRDKIG